MENDGKIIILKGTKVYPNKQSVIKITPEAMRILADITNETSMSMRQVASQIIIQSVEKDLIRFDRKENEKTEE